jgi:hypothetical protein
LPIYHLAFGLSILRVRLMNTKEKRAPKKAGQSATSKREKLSLYPLSIEDALRAAARTGRPPPDEREPRRKRSKPKSS